MDISRSRFKLISILYDKYNLIKIATELTLEKEEAGWKKEGYLLDLDRSYFLNNERRSDRPARSSEQFHIPPPAALAQSITSKMKNPSHPLK